MLNSFLQINIIFCILKNCIFIPIFVALELNKKIDKTTRNMLPEICMCKSIGITVKLNTIRMKIKEKNQRLDNFSFFADF